MIVRIQNVIIQREEETETALTPLGAKTGAIQPVISEVAEVSRQWSPQSYNKPACTHLSVGVSLPQPPPVVLRGKWVTDALVDTACPEPTLGW